MLVAQFDPGKGECGSGCEGVIRRVSAAGRCRLSVGLQTKLFEASRVDNVLVGPRIEEESTWRPSIERHVEYNMVRLHRERNRRRIGSQRLVRWPGNERRKGVFRQRALVLNGFAVPVVVGLLRLGHNCMVWR